MSEAPSPLRLPSRRWSVATATLWALLAILSPYAFGDSAVPDAARIIVEATNGRLAAAKGRMFDADCNQWLDYGAEVVDLNGDGQPEVFTQIHGTCWGGATGSQLNLYIRDRDGRWRPQFGFPGLHRVLETGHGGFPDIEIGGPGFCFPVWRWNGTQYALHRTCPR